MKVPYSLPPEFEGLRPFVDAMRNRLTIDENMSFKQITVDVTGSADTEFTVEHGLGRVPMHYFGNADRAGIIYDSRRSDWTEIEMYLKCSAANAQLTLTIL